MGRRAESKHTETSAISQTAIQTPSGDEGVQTGQNTLLPTADRPQQTDRTDRSNSNEHNNITVTTQM